MVDRRLSVLKPCLRKDIKFHLMLMVLGTVLLVNCRRFFLPAFQGMVVAMKLDASSFTHYALAPLWVLLMPQSLKRCKEAKTPH
jgi:hypothetical protein